MTKKISPGRIPEPSTTPQIPLHAHHWILETPVGPLTDSRCKGCGEERVWDTWGPEDRWAEYRSRAQANGVASRKKKA